MRRLQLVTCQRLPRWPSVGALPLGTVDNRGYLDSQVGQLADQCGIVSATSDVGQLSNRNRSDRGAVTNREWLKPKHDVFGTFRRYSVFMSKNVKKAQAE